MRTIEAVQLFWEDLEVGLHSVSSGRTVGEADLIGFAGLSGDFNAIHMDRVHAERSGLGGQQLVHGLCGMAIASGLLTRSPLGSGMSEQLIAMVSINWTFGRPLYVGDTVHVEAEVVGRRETKRPERGLVEIERRLINQRAEVVQHGVATMMVRRRAESQPPTADDDIVPTTR